MSKGDCYIANGDWCMDTLTLGDRKYIKSIKLCHGVVIGARGSEVDGQEIFHCWIEVGNDMLFDFSNGKEMMVRIDRISHRIIQGKTKKYTLKEASRMMLSTGNYGEWTDEEEERTIGRKIART